MSDELMPVQFSKSHSTVEKPPHVTAEETNGVVAGARIGCSRRLYNPPAPPTAPLKEIDHRLARIQKKRDRVKREMKRVQQVEMISTDEKSRRKSLAITAKLGTWKSATVKEEPLGPKPLERAFKRFGANDIDAVINAASFEVGLKSLKSHDLVQSSAGWFGSRKDALTLFGRYDGNPRDGWISFSEFAHFAKEVSLHEVAIEGGESDEVIIEVDASLLAELVNKLRRAEIAGLSRHW